MIFGIILSLIGCTLVGAGLYFIARDAFGKSPEPLDKVIYVISPYGLAASLFYYVFFWRDVDLTAIFAGFNSMGILADIFVNILIPFIILAGLFLSYFIIQNVWWRFFITMALVFILQTWLDIVWLTFDYSRSHSTPVKPGFPIVQWSCAVFIVALVSAVFMRKRNGLLKKETAPAASM